MIKGTLASAPEDGLGLNGFSMPGTVETMTNPKFPDPIYRTLLMKGTRRKPPVLVRAAWLPNRVAWGDTEQRVPWAGVNRSVSKSCTGAVEVATDPRGSLRLAHLIGVGASHAEISVTPAHTMREGRIMVATLRSTDVLAPVRARARASMLGARSCGRTMHAAGA